jgi:hypothetical protein
MVAPAGSRARSGNLGFDNREIDLSVEDVVHEIRQHELHV